MTGAPNRARGTTVEMLGLPPHLRTRPVSLDARCAAQDQHGRRCRRPAVIETDYHGDGEIYHGKPGLSWVRVELCDKHVEALRLGVGA